MHSNKTNIWGHHIPTPQSVILDPQVSGHISRLLTKVLTLVGLDDASIERFKSIAIQKAKYDQNGSALEYEQHLKAALVGEINISKMDAALIGRANIVHREILPTLKGDSLLDIGCGNGLIANLAKDLFKHVLLLDVVPYISNQLKLPFVLYKEGAPLPVDELYDTVLLLTVLHHSNDPIGLLKLAWAATKQRLLIIESVVGVHHVEPQVNYELVNLSDRDQIAYAAFVDWFYNRVLHDDIPVPYNFTTPENWKYTFSKHNMRLLQTVYLGQDIDIGPEYHVLFVLGK
jgi:2-polyprenyl-3-methyl-5-hydroxy-6-metoxy-1,4-benzoquinol methylase